MLPAPKRARSLVPLTELVCNRRGGGRAVRPRPAVEAIGQAQLIFTE